MTGKAIKSKKKTIKFECSQARTIARKKQRCRSTHNLNMPFHCIRRKQLELHSRCLIAGFPKAPAASRTLLHPFNLLFFCFSSSPPPFLWISFCICLPLSLPISLCFSLFSLLSHLVPLGPFSCLNVSSPLHRSRQRNNQHTEHMGKISISSV